MVMPPKDVFRRTILITDEDFDIDKIYKSFKKKTESLGYALVEKEQGTKSAKYGNEVVFKFTIFRTFDLFGRTQFEFEFLFDNLSKLEGKDHGNCRVNMKGTMFLDYMNKWGDSKFNKILLGLYLKVIGGELKKKYLIPIIQNGNELHDFIKNEFELYR